MKKSMEISMAKKVLSVILLSIFLISASLKEARAEEIPLYKVLKNSFYGGIIGSLLGTAVLAFTDKPSDHLNIIARGAAIGVFVGTVYGLYDAAVYMAEYEEGKMTLSLPNLEANLISSPSREEYPQIKAGIFRYRF